MKTRSGNGLIKAKIRCTDGKMRICWIRAIKGPRLNQAYGRLGDINIATDKYHDCSQIIFATEDDALAAGYAKKFIRSASDTRIIINKKLIC